MRSTFLGLEIARSGLFISQKQIDVTGHNIANVDTPGYSRQRLETASVDPLTGATKFYLPDNGRVGVGVDSLTTRQLRDYFLDRQYRDQISTTGQWDVRANAMDYIDSIFDETNNNIKLGNAISSFFSAINSMVNDYAENRPVRGTVATTATTLNDYFLHKNRSLTDEMIYQDAAVETKTKQINAIAESIAILNEKILSYEFDGKEYANDLRDKRNYLVDELSKIVQIEYGEEVVGTDPTNIHFWITLGDDPSHRLVDHLIIDKLDYQKGAINGLVLLETDNLSRQIAQCSGAIGGTPPLSADELAQVTAKRARMAGELAAYVKNLGGDFTLTYDGNTYTGADDIADIVAALNAMPPDAQLSFEIAGAITPLIADDTFVSLADSGANLSALPDAFNMTAISWSSDGGAVSVTDGELRGHLTMRDGGEVGSNGMPYYLFQLNEYVRSLTNEFNQIHEQGYTMPYSKNGVDYPSITGVSFFVSSDGGPITAANVAVNPIISGIDGSPNNIALSSVPISPVVAGDDTNTQHGNFEVGKELYRMLDKLVDEQGVLFDGLWGALLADIGASANYAKNAQEINQRVSDNLQNQRLSVMGVSIDEEMTNLIRFNHAYGAAARVITAMDEALDKLINGTGRVGL